MKVRTNTPGHIALTLAALGACTPTSCIGREAGGGVTVTSASEAAADEPPTPANDSDYPEIVAPNAAAGSATVSVGLDSRFQTLDGFGAAVAWYEDRIIGETPKGVYDLLFPELGLDIVRFRNRDNRKDNSDNHPEQEAEILKRANQALGRPLKVLMSAWSPPAALKASQVEKCHNNKDCTLAKENGQFAYQKYADFWFTSLQHYAKLGVVPDYVSIQNEPDFIPPDWEGCKFEPSETAQYPGYNKALVAVHAALQKLSPPPKMLGPEVLGIHYNKVQNYLRVMNQDLIFGVAHHLYELGNDGVWDWRSPGPDSFLDEMQGVAAATRKPLYQTEFQTDDDKGIDGGFETAWLVHHTMAVEGAVSFIYWDLVWEGAHGLVSMRGKTPKPRDQYYSMRHFARFTDPGYIRVAANSDAKDVLASAYLSPDEHRVTVVLLNTAKNSMNVRVNAASHAATKFSAFRTVYRPGHSKQWEELKGLTADSAIDMPARSVVTLVLDK
jgi:glucuronoarabinoxylan endo-1,4-beta-xylanase